MASISIAHIKAGNRLGEDVLTPLGGVLFYKGTVITPRELEILQAFLISSVTIDNVDEAIAMTESANEKSGLEKKPASESAKQDKPLTPFQNEYDKMIGLLRNVFATQITAQGMPIMDIRKQLESLLSNIDDYKVLTFIPSGFLERDYLLHSSVCCSLTSYLMGQWTGFPQKELMQIALAGLLHDIGNIRIDKSILTNPNTLSVVEMEEMKRHTVYGYQLIKDNIAINEGVKLSALQHHEKIDGSGYPLGIDSSKIHPYARIVAIADIFHAMTLNKAYRKKISPYLVLDQLEAEGFGKLDPSYVRIFIEKTVQFSSGTIVKLNDDRVGEIVFTDKAHPTRPWVSVNGTIVNLSVERQFHIREIIK